MDSSNKTPMTEDQLAFFTEQTRHAVRKSLRKFSRAAVAGFLILAAGIGFVQYDQRHEANAGRKALVDSGRVISVSGCNRDFDTITVLRGVLESAAMLQREAFNSGELTAEQFRRSQEFYMQQLILLEQPDCRDARDVLTDDPEAQINVPTPLFPEGD